MLMRRADAGKASRHDLATLGDKLTEHAVVLVVDVFDFLHAELAYFLAPEKLASAFARRPAGAASTAASATKSRAISARTIPTGARSVSRCRWCCCLVSH